MSVSPDHPAESSNPPTGVVHSLGEGEVQAENSSALASKAGWVGMLTLVSRVFGLVRDSAIAYVLGTQAGADAFYVAFRIPNLLRRLLAEGNLTLSFVPVFTQSLQRSREEARRVADVTFTLLAMLLTVITLVGVIGAGFFVRFTALGFEKDPEKFAMTVTLTKITFPYIFLVSIGALMMGILNARRRFTAPALSPVMLNLGIIAGAFLLSRHFSDPAVGIAWGVIIGGVLQMLVQIPSLFKEGFLPRLSFDFKNEAVRKIGKLMLPSIYGSAVYQLNLLAITFMASYLPTGSVSYLWYADRIIEFPLGIFAISFATVALPTLSEHFAKNDLERMKKTFRESLAMIWLVNIPAAIGLALLAKPIVALLFYRGDFNQQSTLLTAQTLQCFAVGLPFVSGTRLTATAFYAMHEAKKPVRAANIAVLVNIVAGAILLWPLKHRGLALGVSLGSLANFLMHLYDYRQGTGPLGLKKLFRSSLSMLVAGLIMGATLLTVQHYWDWSFASMTRRSLYTISLIAIGAFVYAVSILALRVPEAAPLLRILGRRFGFKVK